MNDAEDKQKESEQLEEKDTLEKKRRRAQEILEDSALRKSLDDWGDE